MLVLMFLQSYLLISASKVLWKLQPTAARWSGRFSEMHGAMYTVRVSLTRTVRRLLRWNNGQLAVQLLERSWESTLKSGGGN